jgi:aspartyl-tRNA(Asn)/glutamyl-tRNA(Gln) amidotransferase subunit A
MTEIPLHWQTISELSRRIHNGSLSPVELMEHLLNRIEALDGRLHSFRLLSRERALAAARASELALRGGQDMGLLHGIPYAVKDLIDVQGLPTTAGSNLLLDNIASTDATVVRRLTQAGMVLLGKTNTVQFAFGAPGVNHHHGTPHNPWHATPHVPGGSSNGSGVAVGAGLVPIALGTDTGGSVRIPAALCGTVGLKTTVGQVSRAGVFPLSWTFDPSGHLHARWRTPHWSTRLCGVPIRWMGPHAAQRRMKTSSPAYAMAYAGYVWPLRKRVVFQTWI